MITIIWYTLKETIHRRMGVVILVLSLLSPGFFLWKANFTTAANGKVVVSLGRMQLPVDAFAQGIGLSLMSLSGQLWTWIGIFAAAPLLTSYLEKGWAEMQFAKGIPRWQFLLGRYIASVLLFAGSLFCVAGLPMLYFQVRGGISAKSYLIALLFLVFSFAALAAFMALISIQQALPAVPTLAAFLMMIIAAILAERENTFYRIIESKWPKVLMDWAYRILPKTLELTRAANTYWRSGTVEAWWPVWSTGLFVIGCLGLSMWLLHRKSF
jgi:ABC-type transport system involved in multi-copper enzyme maturation permease subunit